MIMCRLWRDLLASLIHFFGLKIPSKVHLLHFANQVATLIMHSTIPETTLNKKWSPFGQNQGFDIKHLFYKAVYLSRS